MLIKKESFFGAFLFAAILLIPNQVYSLEVIVGKQSKVTIDQACTQTLTDGSSITVYYDASKALINMSARVVANSWLGWGWGATMVNTELVVFSANGASSAVQYYYSTTQGMPTADPTVEACYTSSYVDNGDGYI